MTWRTHIPLLLWWAIERAIGTRVAELDLNGFWLNTKIGREVVVPRLIRRAAAELTEAHQWTLTLLLRDARDDGWRKMAMAGIKEGLSSDFDPARLIPQLKEQFTKSGDLELALIAGDRATVERMRSSMLSSPDKLTSMTLRAMRLLARRGQAEDAEFLLKIASNPGREAAAT